MTGTWFFIGILCGIIIGLGLALRITVLRVKKSNDIGDSKGGIRDFGTYVNIMSSEDDLHQCRPSGRGNVIFEHNYREIETRENASY